ncbi:MAG TPA: long-chain-fatty-acid--CoA ligase [Ktedonosporobacter sp.]|jgi:long-chain acyl-CoA synthetase|nr:long-chain-fatty-acid--CoA ligase [Ktedonosporobacter sp.]
MNIAQGLAHAKRVFGNREAITCGETRHTWNDFERRTDHLARGLTSLGIQRGDRVAVLMLNCHRYLELYYACARMGAVIVPLNIRLARPEIVFILNDSESQALIVDKTFAPYSVGRDTFPSVQHIIYCGDETPEGMENYEQLLARGSQRPESADQMMEDDDLSGLYYTGGTTGRAKGVMLSHKNVMSNAMNVIMATSYTDRDVYLHSAPMFHLADIGSAFAITMVGARHVFIPMFHPLHVLRTIQAEKVTIALLVPTMVNMVLNHPDVDNYDVSSLRRLTYGASPMPVELLKQGLQKWGQIFAQGYGMTETAPLLTGLDTYDHIVDGTPEQVRRLASCGKEALGVEVRVVNAQGEDVRPGEIGEIIARGPNIMMGYWRMPEATADAIVDGWMHTGDLATVDEENYIFIIDRAKDMIISGGENVYSVEVENALYTHPAVLEAAVIGIPAENWGESVHAVVVCKPGMSVTDEELIAHARTLIAGYKVPRSVEFLDEPLPKSGAGKILKRELREKYWADKNRQVN